MTIDEFVKLNPEWKSDNLKGTFDSLIILPEKIKSNDLQKVDFSKIGKEEIKFRFKNSFLVTDKGVISTLNGKFYSFEEVKKFKVVKKGFFSIKGYFTEDDIEVDKTIGLLDFTGEVIQTFLSYLDQEETERLQKEEESIPVIKEEVSNDLIRIITTGLFEFWCFEFRKDSIKVYELRRVFYGEVGNPVFFRNKKVFLVLKDGFQIQDNSIYQTTSWGEPRESRSHSKVFDINIYNDSYLIENRKIEFVDLESHHTYSDGSGGDSKERFHYNTNPDELNKLEKILYFFKNITSYENMISLEKSYSEHQNVLSKNKELLLNELDVDGNGVIDISENNDFSKLLKSKQKLIIEFEKSEGKNYIQNFVKLSKYLKDKSENIQSLFEILREDSNISNDKYDEYAGVLKNQINTYNLMLLSSLNMIITLTEDDRITFYEIYETFDKLNVFTSNHEREMSIKLKNIEYKLDELVQSIYQMEMNICSELYNLQFITEDMSDSLSGLSKGLSEINSSIQTNNLLTGIQTYQMYKINQNIKRLKS